MRKLWPRIINIGVHEELLPSEAKYIRLSNGITVMAILAACSLLPNFIIFLPDTLPLLLNLIVFLVLYPGVLLLNYQQRHLWAKVYLFLVALESLSLTAFFIGSAANFHFYLLLVIMVACFIHPAREKRIQYVIISSTLIVFIGLEIWFVDHAGWVPLPPQFIFVSRISNDIGFLLVLLGFLLYIAWNYRRAEADLEEERKKTEQLLHNVLPIPIAQRLKNQGYAIADGFASITILFSDLVGFTPLSERMTPEALVALLNQVFSKFDHLVEKYGLEKIKTIGDAYMVASGLPLPRNDHAQAIANLALEMRAALAQFNAEQQQTLNIRIGIHTGPAVAGVIGIKKFSYDVWGDTVNTASRMESHSPPGKIQVSESTYQQLKTQYIFTERGLIEIKGKGPMKTFLLEGKL